jgi:hypothetical protein
MQLDGTVRGGYQLDLFFIEILEDGIYTTVGSP